MENLSDTLFSVPVMRLLYHGQYVLGPRFVEHLEGWKRVQIARSVYLTAHPDLNVCQVTEGEKSVTLLGFMLDPYDPPATDEDILRQLFGELSTCDRFFHHTDRFGGRWALIVDDGSQMILFHDPLGQRQVFYTDVRYTGDLWCASQPGIVAGLLGLRMDRDAVNFFDWCRHSGMKEYSFPGDSSPFKEIRRLLPNHYLDFGTGKSHRYWPVKALDQVRLDEAVERTSRILRGLLAGAASRFSLQLDLTAGVDTRIVLAASREIRHDVSYMTLRTIGMAEDFADLTVPAMLASKLGLRHDIVVSAPIVDARFLDIFRQNVTLAQEVHAPDAQAILKYYGLTKVCVTGVASEEGKLSYTFGKLGDRWTTPQELSGFAGMEHPFSVKAFGKWLSELGDLYGLNLFRQFHWETRGGNWIAMTQLEFDIAYQDALSPFNCREALIIAASVDADYRKPPNFVFFRHLINSMWPDVLAAPINPHKKMQFHLVKRGYFNRLRLALRSRDPRYFFPL